MADFFKPREMSVDVVKEVYARASAKESSTFALVGFVMMLVRPLVLLLSLVTVERTLDWTFISLRCILILSGASMCYIGRCSESTSMGMIKVELTARGKEIPVEYSNSERKGQ